MDLVYSEVPSVTVADGTGLYPSKRVQLHVRCCHRRVMAGRTGRSDRQGCNGLQDGFLRVDTMMLRRLHIRSQDAFVRDQEFGTIPCRLGQMTLLQWREVP